MWLFKKFKDKEPAQKRVIKPSPIEQTPPPSCEVAPPLAVQKPVVQTTINQPIKVGALPDDFWPVLAKLPYDFCSEDFPWIRQTPEYKKLYDEWQAELSKEDKTTYKPNI